MNHSPRRSALSRADLVDAIACGLPDGETSPGPGICYLANQLNLYWQPPKQQEAKQDKPLPDTSSTGIEKSGLPDMLETPLLDVPFWRVEARDFFTDESAEADTRTASVPAKYEGWRNKPTQPPRFQPLATWAELAPRLRLVLSDYREGRAIDVGKTIWHISRGDVLEHFPHEHRRRWGPSLLLIEDDSRRLIPYRADKRLVREAVRRLLPTHALSRAVINDGLDRPFLVGSEPDAWPPPPGSLVLTLGDLGCLAVQGSGLRQRWQDIGLELLEAGCHPLALFPAPAARCPPELAKVWRVIPWERPRLADDGGTPAERAERLLRLVATASRIEPSLLRAARLLLPVDQADAGTEADVWQHPSLISDSAAAATLLPAEAQKLRLAFSSQEHTDIRLRLVRLLKTMRGGLPEEIWYDELLNFDPDAILADADLAMDLDDARRYFATFCAKNHPSSVSAMPVGDRAWIARLQARSTQHLWKDPQIGARLAELAIAITSEIPIGIHPGDIPARGQPERRVHLIQTGNALSVVHTLSETSHAGSLLAEVSTRNGLIEFEPNTDSVFETESVFDDFWETGTPPPWADGWGWDEYGAWVTFSVTGKDGLRASQQMRWIEPGSFLMGSPEAEAERFGDEGPQHEVNIQLGYWLFDTACTQALWQAVMGENPSNFTGADRPVEQVSWDDAQKFIQVLNQKLPGLDLGLPSEAQWEYACRAGTTTPFSFGGKIIPEQVNYDGTSPYAGGKKGLYRQNTVPVKRLPANFWGLFQMHGNVREWVQDVWHGNYNNAPNDGSAWEPLNPPPSGEGKTINPLPLGEGRVRANVAGAGRVLRGGSWYYGAWNCRSAYRLYNQPDARDLYTGFRCARTQGREPSQQAAGRGKADAERSVASLPKPRPAAPVFDRSLAPRPEVGRNKPAPAGVSGKLAGGLPETVVARPYSGLQHGPQRERTGVPPFEKGGLGGIYPARILRLDTATKVNAPLPQSHAFTIHTDREKLTLRQIVKPAWAKSMGRDRFGLWADIAIETSLGQPVIQRLRWIPPGRFMMGSPVGEPGRWDDEGPQHPVTIKNGYWLFDTPCTQALWQAVVGKNPSRFQDSDRPVEKVSWDDIQQRFLPELNKTIPGFILPSEAQWEYACRAGTDTAIYTGGIELRGDMDAPALDPIAWYGGNSGVDYDLSEAEDSTKGWWEGKQKQYDHKLAGTRKVKGKHPNPWGLYDMLGNVWEWVADPWHSNYEGATMDGSVWELDGNPLPPGEGRVRANETGAGRVLRGGSWRDDARLCRSAYRILNRPGNRNNSTGFRCARVQS